MFYPVPGSLPSTPSLPPSPPQLIEKKQYGVDGDTRVDYTRPLPRPFVGRPRLGTRLFVRANARRIMKPLLKELRTLCFVRKRLHLQARVCWSVRGVILPLPLLVVLPADDWIADTRSKAVTLLCTSLVYLEEHITQDVRMHELAGVCVPPPPPRVCAIP
jgi:hypothetical protein